MLDPVTRQPPGSVKRGQREHQLNPGHAVHRHRPPSRVRPPHRVGQRVKRRQRLIVEHDLDRPDAEPPARAGTTQAPAPRHAVQALRDRPVRHAAARPATSRPVAPGGGVGEAGDAEGGGPALTEARPAARSPGRAGTRSAEPPVHPPQSPGRPAVGVALHPGQLPRPRRRHRARAAATPAEFTTQSAPVRCCTRTGRAGSASAGRAPGGRAARPPTRGSRRSAARRPAAPPRRPRAAAPQLGRGPRPFRPDPDARLRRGQRPQVNMMVMQPGQQRAPGRVDLILAAAARRPGSHSRIRPAAIRTSTTPRSRPHPRVPDQHRDGPVPSQESTAAVSAPIQRQRRQRRQRGQRRPAAPATASAGRHGRPRRQHHVLQRRHDATAIPTATADRPDHMRPVVNGSRRGEPRRHPRAWTGRSAPAPVRDRPRHRERPAQSGQRIRDRVRAEHGFAAPPPPRPDLAGPADQPARHRRVVPERDQLSSRRVAAPVPGNAEPDLAIRCGIISGASPSCASARGRDASITTSAAAINAPSAAAPIRTEIQHHAAMPPCSQSKNRRSPARPPSGRSGVSTLMTAAPASPSSRAHSGPAHIDDRSTTTAPASRVPGRRGDPPARPGAVPPVLDARPSASSAARLAPRQPRPQLCRQRPRRQRPRRHPEQLRRPRQRLGRNTTRRCLKRPPRHQSSPAPRPPQANIPPPPPFSDDRRNRGHVVGSAQVDDAPPCPPRAAAGPNRLADTRPRLRNPASAARPAQHLARVGAHLDPVAGVAAASWPRPPSAARSPPPAYAAGAPSARPVSAIAPDAAQPSTGHPSSIWWNYPVPRRARFLVRCQFTSFSGTGTSGSSSAPRASPTSATPPGASSSRSTSSS